MPSFYLARATRHHWLVLSGPSVASHALAARPWFFLVQVSGVTDALVFPSIKGILCSTSAVRQTPLSAVLKTTRYLVSNAANFQDSFGPLQLSLAAPYIGCKCSSTSLLPWELSPTVVFLVSTSSMRSSTWSTSIP